MKTKPIFVLLLTLLFCLGVNLRNPGADCLCPPELTNSFERQTTISNAIQDLCNDCGHTTNCCFSHTDIPTASSLTWVQPEFQDYAITVPATNTVLPARASAELARRDLNKAPPNCQRLTLVSLNQRLLI
jgi:hypothetical protein